MTAFISKVSVGRSHFRAERVKVLQELNEYNVNSFSLFGSEKSLMDTLATQQSTFPMRTRTSENHAARNRS